MLTGSIFGDCLHAGVGVSIGSSQKFSAVGNGVIPTIYCEEKLFVLNGEKFTIVSSKSGLIKRSDYLNKGDWWIEAYGKVRQVVHISKKTIVVGNPGYRNYYHWTYQIWLSLVYLHVKLKDFSDYQILGPSLNGWRRQYIDLLGLVNYVEADPLSSYIIDEAIFTDVMWGGYAFAPSNEIFNTLDVDILSDAYVGYAEKIFVTRRDATKRGLENEAALEAMLITHGYRTVVLSELTVVQQIELFRSARYIVAPHGAGLTNLIFSRSGASLIELISEDYLNPCFFAVCAARGIEYTGVVSASTTNISGYHHSKMIVDIPLVEKLILLQAGS